MTNPCNRCNLFTMCLGEDPGGVAGFVNMCKRCGRTYFKHLKRPGGELPLSCGTINDGCEDLRASVVTDDSPFSETLIYLPIKSSKRLMDHYHHALACDHPDCIAEAQRDVIADAKKGEWNTL